MHDLPSFFLRSSFAMPSFILRSGFASERRKSEGRARARRKHDEIIYKKKAYIRVSLFLMDLFYFCTSKLHILDLLTRSDLWFLPFTIKHADC